jgi:Protein of unknown function (DUF2510)
MPKQAARRYPYAYLAVFDHVARAIPLAGTRYHFVSADARNGMIQISASMNLLTWGENLTLAVRAETPGWTRVDLVVASKFQLIDWGQRARDIREIFGAIDRLLPNGQPVDVESARLTQSPAPLPTIPVTPAAPLAQTPPPAWHPDPTGRHEHRYWDGHAWSEHVSDGGVRATDPIA